MAKKKTKPEPEFDVELVKLLTADVVARLALVQVDVAPQTDGLLEHIPRGAAALAACRKALTFYARACHRVLTYVWPSDLPTQEHETAIQCFLPTLQICRDRFNTAPDTDGDGENEEPEPQLTPRAGGDALGPPPARVAPTCQRAYLAYRPGVVEDRWSAIYPRYVGCISCCAKGKICVFAAPGRKCESCKSGCKIFAAADEPAEVTVHKANTDLKKKYLLPKLGEDSTVRDGRPTRPRKKKERATPPPDERSSGESEAGEEEEIVDTLPDILAKLDAKKRQLLHAVDRVREASAELLASVTSETRKTGVIAQQTAFPAHILTQFTRQEVREWEDDFMLKLRAEETSSSPVQAP